MKSQNSRSESSLRVRVTATAETLIRRGHPWVFANSVREQNRDGTQGELAILFDRQNKFLAVGLFDPESPIRIRILHAGKPQLIDASWWRSNLERALEKRHNLSQGQTNGYRCINGESDHWPALVLDRYDRTYVLKIYSGIWFRRLAEITDLLQEVLPHERIVLRLSRNIRDAAKQFHLTDGQILRGAPLSDTVTFLENGLRFEADVILGQKTGFFLDQRENRKIVETLARGRAVLNAFSFSGGFSAYAAHGGATSVTDLDISAHSLAAAKRNFALNANDPHLSRCRHETIQADVFEWLQHKATTSFDLVILDPPSLAKRETERSEAIRAYGKLTSGGIARLKKGGILVAASCSAHVSAEEFFGAVRQAARISGRTFFEIQTTRHAIDHEATFKEAEYLKCIYLRFDS